MQTGIAPRGGYILMRTPTARQQARRRWLVVVCAMAALAITSGLIGSLAGAPKTAPSAHSYLPTQ